MLHHPHVHDLLMSLDDNVLSLYILQLKLDGMKAWIGGLFGLSHL
jgi:hypothetical protein